MKTNNSFFDVSNKYTPFILVLVVLGLWLLCWVLTINLAGDNYGVFGDMFGSVNALFSGLAFSGIIYTILLQREELTEQRKQLELNRIEMKLSREEFETQNITLKRTRFETMFFQMLTFHLPLVDREALSKYFETFSKVIHHSYTSHVEMNKNAFYLGEASLVPYLKSLVALHFAINDAGLNDNANERYYRLIAAYTSDREKQFLYYFLSTADTNSDLVRDLLKAERDFKMGVTNKKLLNHKHELLRAFLEARINAVQ